MYAGSTFQHRSETMGKKGKKSKKKTIGGGIATTRLLEPSMEYYAQLASLNDEEDERRRRGTSAVYDNGYYGRNDEAQKLSDEAHKMKKACNFQKAHELYTAAIELDKFNHFYFFQRAATACKGKCYEDGIKDCQLGLDLCMPFERYKYDNCFASLVWTLTMCYMDTHQWDKANEICQLGLKVIGQSEETSFALETLRKFNPEIRRMLKTMPSDYARAIMKPVRNADNHLSFMYSTKAASLSFNDIAPNQPELLVVDIVDGMPTKEMFEIVFPDRIKAWQDTDVLEKDDGLTFQIPDTSYWFTVIPVWKKEDRKIIQTHLMCDCLKNTKVVILKLEKSEEPPIVDTALYIASIVKNADKCEALYDRGSKLVAED